MSEQDLRELRWIASQVPPDLEREPPELHPGQSKAWRSDKRFVLVVAGAQSGKTYVGARLLAREIQRTAKNGEQNDYLIVGPNTELLKKKAVTEFAKATRGLAEFKASEKCFVFTPQGARDIVGGPCDVRVFLGYAHDPDSLEAATYKAVWADECGQASFLRESWEALQRRVAIEKGRVFMTSTPYKPTGWLRDMHDDAKAGRRTDTDVVNFRSTENPRFSTEEFERQRAELPDWKFRMFYLGEFTRPAGAVFSCFDRSLHMVRAFRVPDHWPRFVGVDFGENNTAAVFLAADPETTDLYVYATYHAGGRTVAEHVANVQRKCGAEIGLAVGGSWSEEEWRRDYAAAGLSLARPHARELEVGIQRLYAQFKRGKLKVFDTCEKLATEIESYARELDDRGEPLEAIHDKSKFHRLDALRYIVSTLRPTADPQVTQYSRLTLTPPRIV